MEQYFLIFSVNPETRILAQVASLIKGTPVNQLMFDRWPPTANGKGIQRFPLQVNPNVRGPPAPYAGNLGKGKGSRDRSHSRGGRGSLAPRGASEIGSTYGPPSDDWTLNPPSPAIEAIPEIPDILTRIRVSRSGSRTAGLRATRSGWGTSPLIWTALT